MGIKAKSILAIAILALAAVILSVVFTCDISEKSAESQSGDKRIALTYDDAPRGDGPIYSGTERTDNFLKQLRDSDVDEVTMFVTTRGMDKPEGRQRIEAYANAGHLIANHSDTHQWASRTPIDQYIADLDAAERKLKSLPNRRPWYRFPYLDEGGYGEENADLVRRDLLRTALSDRGLINGYVTVDTFDWHLEHLWLQAARAGMEVDEMALSRVYVDMVLDAARHYDAMSQKVIARRAAQVLLLHENDLAARFTGDLVAALRADGWKIISADEAYRDEIATIIPATRIAGDGRLSAIAHDKGWSGEKVFDHWSTSEKGIEDRVRQYSVFSSLKEGKRQE